MSKYTFINFRKKLIFFFYLFIYIKYLYVFLTLTFLKLIEVNMVLINVLFDKIYFDLEESINYLKKNNLKHNSCHEIDNYYVFNQNTSSKKNIKIYKKDENYHGLLYEHDEKNRNSCRFF